MGERWVLMTKCWLTMAKLCFTSVMLVLIGFAGTAAADNGSDNGAVYTMTNDPNGNAVVVYARAADGTLTMSGTFPTGGTSIGVFATGNQHGLLLGYNASCLWAVNSLSNQVSAFQVQGTSLSLTNVVGSGGSRPVSVGLNENLGVLYVLNAGGQVGSSDNVTGFTVGQNCGLSPLAGSTRALSGSNVSPAEVSFNPTGSVVVVTEKTDNSVFTPPPGTSPPLVRGGHITTFIVGDDGLLRSRKSVAPPVIDGFAITEPFGFTFNNRGQLLVAAGDCTQPQPPGNLPTCSVAPPDNNHPALLSYNVARNGTLTLVDALIDNQAAKCWIAITDNQKFPFSGQQFAFTVNDLATQPGGTPGQPPSGSITGYQVSPDGSLTELEPGVTLVPLMPVGFPIDDALSRNSRFLYVLNEGDGTVNAFKVGLDGGLTLINTYPITTLPAIQTNGPFPNGLAAQ
jgi:6-phosphogluconolactonase